MFGLNVKKLNFILLIAAFVICHLTLVIVPPEAGAAPRKYLAQHWITGRVIGAPDGTQVTLCMAANPTITTTGTTLGGNYRINAFTLGWRDGPTWRIITDPLGEPRAEVKDLLGTGGTAGPVGLAPGEPSLIYSSGYGVEHMADMTYSGIRDIAYGPQIRVKALFQAFADTSTWSHALPCIVRVEVRDVPPGTPLSADNAGNATRSIAYADVVLNLEGNTVGRNGFLKPDGSEFGSATPWIGGSYYLAVKQKASGATDTLVGLPHLSVITQRRIGLRTTIPYNREASTTNLDLTNDPTRTDSPGPGGIYKEIPYKPAANKPDALFEDPASRRRWLRAGDLDGNNIVDVGDSGLWIRLFEKNQRDEPDDPADPYIRANLDRNCDTVTRRQIIDVGDRGYWIGTFNFMYLGGDPTARDPGPHGYVPASIP